MKNRLEHFLSAPTSRTAPWELHSLITNMYFALYLRQGSRPKFEAVPVTLLHRTMSHMQIYMHQKLCASVTRCLVTSKLVTCYVGLYETGGYGDILVEFAFLNFQDLPRGQSFELSFRCKQQAFLLNIYAICTNSQDVIPKES